MTTNDLHAYDGSAEYYEDRALVRQALDDGGPLDIAKAALDAFTRLESVAALRSGGTPPSAEQQKTLRRLYRLVDVLAAQR